MENTVSRSTMEALPEDILTELTRKYFEQRYSSLDDHVAWLAEQGHTVSRLSLHRYMAAMKYPHLEDLVEWKKAVQNEESVRFRCLEIASTLYEGRDQRELLGLAEDLIEWIQTTDSARNPVA